MRRIDRHLITVHKMTRQSKEYSDHLQRATWSVLSSPDTDSNSSSSAGERSELDAVESDVEEADNRQTQEDEVYDDPEEILKEVCCSFVYMVTCFNDSTRWRVYVWFRKGLTPMPRLAYGDGRGQLHFFSLYMYDRTGGLYRCSDIWVFFTCYVEPHTCSYGE